jgi:undecaprenyl-diphosphatase
MLVTIVVCLAGGLTLNVLMKLAFQRARPVLDEPLLTLATYSFPSGHVAGSTLMYGLLVAWTFGRTRRAAMRVAVVLGAAAMIALVAFTRMYLGVHYLSDVVAAFAEGVAWLALCLTALTAYWGVPPMQEPAAPLRRVPA